MKPTMCIIRFHFHSFYLFLNEKEYKSERRGFPRFRASWPIPKCYSVPSLLHKNVQGVQQSIKHGKAALQWTARPFPSGHQQNLTGPCPCFILFHSIFHEWKLVSNAKEKEEMSKREAKSGREKVRFFFSFLSSSCKMTSMFFFGSVMTLATSS